MLLIIQGRINLTNNDIIAFVEKWTSRLTRPHKLACKVRYTLIYIL